MLGIGISLWQTGRDPSLPRIAVSGTLVLGSTDTPPEAGSLLTLTDTLVFDPTADAYTVTLQTRLGNGPWEALEHDIEAEPYEVPSGSEGRSYRVRAVATADGYSARTVTSNVLTVAGDGPETGDALLLETGDTLLLESGDKILMEA